MNSAETVNAACDSMASKFNENDLRDCNKDDNRQEQVALKNSSENVEAIVDLSCGEEAEDLEEHESVEYHSKVTRRTVCLLIIIIKICHHTKLFLRVREGDSRNQEKMAS